MQLHTKPQIKLTRGEHRNQAVVFVRFDYNREIIKRLNETMPKHWSQSKGCWYILKDEFELGSFFEAFKEMAFIDYSAVTLKHEPLVFENIKPDYSYRSSVELPKGYIEILEQKRYSQSTIRTYSAYFKDFIHYFAERDISEITVNEINEYILSLVQLAKISGSEQNQRINSIKFYFEKVLKRNSEYYTIERARKERKLPDVLSRNEIKQIFNSLRNLKHKCILELIYSAGLRRSEVLNLKPADIDSKRLLIKVRGGKGKKDRYSLLSENVLNDLRKYFRAYQPKNWLFEGQNGGQYSTTSVAMVLKRAAIKAGIKRRVHVHMLRHSFATHLLEQGTNLRVIQELLGHDNVKTTEIYTHVSNLEIKNVKNPIDEIF